MWTRLLGNSAMPLYIKVMSAAILMVTYFAVLAYAGYFAISHNGDLTGLPSFVTNFVIAGLVMALSNLNIHTGASVTESGANTLTSSPTAPANTQGGV